MLISTGGVLSAPASRQIREMGAQRKGSRLIDLDEGPKLAAWSVVGREGRGRGECASQ